MVTSIWVNINSGNGLMVMACYLMASSHYLTSLSHTSHYLWLLISEVLWHSTLSNFPVSAQATILYNMFQNYTFKITATSPRGQWVNTFFRWLCNYTRYLVHSQLFVFIQMKFSQQMSRSSYRLSSLTYELTDSKSSCMHKVRKNPDYKSV